MQILCSWHQEYLGYFLSMYVSVNTGQVEKVRCMERWKGILSLVPRNTHYTICHKPPWLVMKSTSQAPFATWRTHGFSWGRGAVTDGRASSEVGSWGGRGWFQRTRFRPFRDGGKTSSFSGCSKSFSAPTTATSFEHFLTFSICCEGIPRGLRNPEKHSGWKSKNQWEEREGEEERGRESERETDRQRHAERRETHIHEADRNRYWDIYLKREREVEKQKKTELKRKTREMWKRRKEERVERETGKFKTHFNKWKRCCLCC